MKIIQETLSAIMYQKSKNGRFLHIGSGPVLVSESDIPELLKYGNGFRILRYVGNLVSLEGEKKN